MKIQHRLLLPTLLLMAAATPALRGGTFTDESYTDPALGTMHYRVYLPDNYKTKGTTVPVILYLHSAAERGDTVEAVFANNGWTNTWIPQLVNETQTGKHQAVLVVPESGSWQVWNSMTAGDNWGVGDYTDATQKPISPRLQLAVDILDRVMATHNIDKNRIYLTGGSMGGYGTWDALARFPKKFAAAMPLAGAGNLDAARKVFNGKPVWIFHGADDTLIPTRHSDDLAAAMRATGGRPIYSRVAGIGHGGFDLFYTPGYFTVDSPSAPGGKGKDVYDWLFSQTFASEGTVIHPSAPIVVEMSGINWARNMNDTLADGKGAIWFNRGYPSANHGGGIVAMVDTNGVETGLSMTYVSGNVSGFTQVPVASYSDKIKGVFAGASITQGIGTAGDAKAPLVWTLGGLDDRTKYTFEIISCREGKGTARSAFEVVGANTVKGVVNPSGNFQAPLVLAEVRPLQGKLTLKNWSADAGETSSFMAFRILRIPPRQ